MPSASPDEAQILCVSVAHDLHKNLLGHCDIAQLRISRATQLDGDNLECVRTEGAALAKFASAAGLKTPAQASTQSALSPHDASQLLVPAEAPTARLFTPVWDVQKEAITTYRCTRITGAAPFEALPVHADFKTEVADLIADLRFATMTLAKDLSAGHKYLLSVPVPYNVLGSPVARMEIATLCRNLSSAMRPYLQFEICEMPYGVPQSRLSELVGSLRPFCRSIVACLPARMPSYAAYQGAGLSAIGLSLSASTFANTEMGSEVFKLAAAAQRLQLRSFILDVPNCDMLLSAHRQKVNAMSGHMFGKPVPVPEPVKRLSLAEIVARGIGEVERKGRVPLCA
jgi:hypothetical protein